MELGRAEEAKRQDLPGIEAIAQGRNRILLTLASGTGKTFIAFQIA